MLVMLRYSITCGSLSRYPALLLLYGGGAFSWARILSLGIFQRSTDTNPSSDEAVDISGIPGHSVHRAAAGFVPECVW